jgi:hypothetical protein
LLYATAPNVVIILWLQKGRIDTLTALNADLPDDGLPVCADGQPNLPVNNVAELVALAKKEPGKLPYFSVGIGSATHLNPAWLTQAAVIDVTHVPYKASRRDCST